MYDEHELNTRGHVPDRTVVKHRTQHTRGGAVAQLQSRPSDSEQQVTVARRHQTVVHDHGAVGGENPEVTRSLL